ncbi:MAG: hypothetical protein ABSE45_10225 [Candidatus Acidiferrales bacterium]|jgi:hypothetical protein
MRLLWKLVLLNVFAVIGAFCAIFLLPGDTPVKLFLAVCVPVIVLLNAGLVVVPRLRRRKDATQAGPPKKRDYWSYVVIALGWAYLIFTSSWGRVVAVVAAATVIVGLLAVWIAEKAAGSK